MPKRYGWSQTAVVFITVISILIVTWLLLKPPTHGCETTELPDVYQIHPVKVVFRPWLGQHHVFGIFMVPYEYRSGRTYSGVLSVESFVEEFVPDSQPPAEHAEEIVAEPGYYLIRAYVPTRTALRLILHGHFGDLQALCNWRLELKRRLSRAVMPFSIATLDSYAFSEPLLKADLRS